MEVKVEHLMRDLASVQDREQRLIRENAEMNSRKSELEKIKTNLELEVKSSQSKYQQLMSSQSSIKSHVSTDDLNNVKGLETKLADEKALRLRAEASIQDKEREINIMSVDFRQLQYKYEKSESEYRQESEKLRAVLGKIYVLNYLRKKKSFIGF